jgi:hypothetical protein
LNFSNSNCAFFATAFAVAVSASLAEIRSLENCSLIPPIFIDPIVPTRTDSAPITKTIFDTLNKKSAPADVIFHISTLTVLGGDAGCVGSVTRLPPDRLSLRKIPLPIARLLRARAQNVKVRL